jgi:hypothetical protein
MAAEAIVAMDANARKVRDGAEIVVTATNVADGVVDAIGTHPNF